MFGGHKTTFGRDIRKGDQNKKDAKLLEALEGR